MMHPNARQRLTQLLLEVLPKIRVQNNSFVVWSRLDGIGALNRVISDRDETRKRLSLYIGEEAVSDFVVGRLSDWLIKREFTSAGDTVSLDQLDEFAGADAVAAELLSELDSLPWKYRAFTAVPWELGEELYRAMGASEMQLTPRVRLIRLSEDTEPQLAREPENKNWLSPSPQSGVSNDVVYICGDLEGYIPRFGESAPLAQFDSEVKAFFGLLIGIRLAEPKASYFSGSSERPILIYREHDGRTVLEHPHHFQADVGDAIRALGVNPILRKYAPEARALAVVKDELCLVAQAFAHSENRHVVRAAEWLFDSYASKSELLGFVQATVALEILFGDKAVSDVIGLGELLANRAAYLVGTTHSQRTELLADFRRIYQTRSQIVHRGHNRLSATEMKDLTKLRWLAGRALRRELELLQADEDSRR